jgi:hypothetical protein
MALTPTQARTFSFGHVYAAPVGTAEPTNISAVVDTDDWTELGHISDAGPRFSLGRTTTPKYSWQSFPEPVRVLTGASVKQVSYDLLQWGRESIITALGGAFTGTTPNFVYTPDGIPPERALILELVDGTAKWRWIVRRTVNQAPFDFAATSTELAPIPIQSVFLQPDDDAGSPVAPYIIQTNDAATGS